MARTRVSGSTRRVEALRRAGQPQEGGFTLIEMLVVLALIAALIAIAYPEFARLYASVAVALDRGDIERQLLELPEAARTAARGGVLLDPDADAAAALAAAGSDRGGIDPEAWRPLHLALPKGWSLAVPRPIRYHFTGACDGGEVVVSRPPLSLRYQLLPPLCRPLLANANAP